MIPDGQHLRSAPVIAVLPFRDDGGRAEISPVPTVLSEAVIGELTRFSGIEVIAPQSAAAVCELPEQDAAARLGADYILTGRLMSTGGSTKLAVTLVSGVEATPVWHESLELSPQDAQLIIDELIARIAATFSAQLFGDVLRRSRRRKAEPLDGFEILARGHELLRTGTRASDEKARALFNQVLDRDPESAAALGGVALSWFNEWSCDFWGEFDTIGHRAYEFAHRALAIDDRDAWLHLILGRILLYRREFDRAAWYVDRALALAPNDAELLIQLVTAEVFLGRPDAAAAHAEKAFRLNPYHPNYYYAYAAFPPFVERDFATAIATAERAAGVMIIDGPAFSAIACAHLGQWEKAQSLVDLFDVEFRRRITRGRDPEPGEAFQWLVTYNPFRRQEDIELVAEGALLLDAKVLSTPPRSPDDPRRLATEAALSSDNDGWTFHFEGKGTALPNLKGLNDLATLLSQPGLEVHCSDLAERNDVYRGEPVIDENGRQTIKARIRDLQEELTEAEDMNDLGRAELVRGERDQLIEELSSALGIGGRSRRMGDLADRARSTVTWRIRHAIRRIEKSDPILGRHLSNSVKTGLFCSYQPEREIKWRVTLSS